MVILHACVRIQNIVGKEFQIEATGEESSIAGNHDEVW